VKKQFHRNLLVGSTDTLNSAPKGATRRIYGGTASHAMHRRSSANHPSLSRQVTRRQRHSVTVDPCERDGRRCIAGRNEV